MIIIKNISYLKRKKKELKSNWNTERKKNSNALEIFEDTSIYRRK
jgi:hypothetical protein